MTNPFLLSDEEFEAIKQDYAGIEDRVLAYAADGDPEYRTAISGMERGYAEMSVVYQPTGQVITRPYEYELIPCEAMNDTVRHVLLKEPLLRPGEALVRTLGAELPTIMWVGTDNEQGADNEDR